MGRPITNGMPDEPPENIVERAVRKLIQSFPDHAPIEALANRQLFTQEECFAWLNSLSEEQQKRLKYEWAFYARPKQRTPQGFWKNWIIVAGRGFGKSKCAAEWVRERIESGECKHIALIGPSANDIRKVMIEDQFTAGSGLMQICPPWNMPTYVPTVRRLEWRNPNFKSYDAACSLYSGEEPELLRGPAHDGAWLDEIMRMRRQEMVWDMLQMGLRRGDNPQCVISTTPKNTPLMKRLISLPNTVVTRGSTIENQKNLAASFLDELMSEYVGTTLGEQEIFGELLQDTEGALWTRAMIESNRVDVLPQLQHVAIGVDPQTGGISDDEDIDVATKLKQKSMTGIVVGGTPKRVPGLALHAYVIADYSENLTPLEWGRKVCWAYRQHDAEIVILEGNQGGKMAEFVIKQAAEEVGIRVRVKIVTAVTKKHERAQPVVAKYEQGRVHHLGVLEKLEDEQVTYLPGDEDRKKSPNRMDALTWLIRHLLVTEARAGAGIALRRRI